MILTTNVKLLLIAILAIMLVYPVCATVTTVDNTASVGLYSSIALDSSGKPHISYYDATNTILKYAKWNGTGWELTTVPKTSGSTGQYTSIAINSTDYPGISHYDSSYLKYSYYNGTGWATDSVAGSSGIYGTTRASRFTTGDDPRISYYYIAADEGYYASKTAGSWSNSLIDTTGTTGRDISLVLNSSNYPEVAYWGSTTLLTYAKWNGTGWLKTSIDSVGNVGFFTSIALNASEYPCISYHDITNNRLKCAIWNGTGWNTGFVGSNDFTGNYGTSIAVDSNDVIHIAYYNFDELMYATRNGSSWDTEVLDTVGDVGRYPSLAIDSANNPHVSYYDVTNTALKYYTPDVSAPVANFTSNVTTGSSPLAVLFTDTSTNTPTSWNWSFGDGNYSELQNPSHLYEGVNTFYDVALTATNMGGSDDETKVAYIVVECDIPDANFVCNTTSGFNPLDVGFTDTSTHIETVMWDWDFGDGSAHGSTETTSHQYNTTGTWYVNLTVTNVCGYTDYKVQAITVYDVPVTTATPVPWGGLTSCANVTTNTVTGLGSHSATLNGYYNGTAGDDLWFRYGGASGSYPYTSSKQNATASPMNFSYALDADYIFPGTTYYVRACSDCGCGSEVSFMTSTPTVTLAPIDTLRADEFISAVDDGFNITGMFDAGIGMYTDYMGNLFFAFIIFIFFAGMFIRQEQPILPLVLALLGMLVVIPMLPGDWFYAVAGIVVVVLGFWLYYIGRGNRE